MQEENQLDVKLIIHRLRDVEGLNTDADVGKLLGISASAIWNWKNRNSVDFNALYTYCVSNDISLDWLLSGEGTPKRHGVDNKMFMAEETSVYNRGEKKISNQAIPVYDIRATAGIEGVFNGNKSIPIDTIQIPNLPKCDGAIFATGDSMYPLIKSGDILMFKQVENSIENVFFGEMYIVAMDLAGDEYLAVKWVQKSEKGDKYIKLVSENQHHQPKDVKLKDVKALALIKAHTRIYTMR